MSWKTVRLFICKNDRWLTSVILTVRDGKLLEKYVQYFMRTCLTYFLILWKLIPFFQLHYYRHCVLCLYEAYIAFETENKYDKMSTVTKIGLVKCILIFERVKFWKHEITHFIPFNTDNDLLYHRESKKAFFKIVHNESMNVDYILVIHAQ